MNEFGHNETPPGTGRAVPQFSAKHLRRQFPGGATRTGRLAVGTTYKAGKMVVLREDNGSLNTHFRGFNAIAERPVAKPCCGVWVVDIATGQTVVFVKFEDGVREIFAVEVVADRRFPDVLCSTTTTLRS